MNKRIQRKVQNQGRPYKNEEQLQYVEALCKRPLVFHHAVEESHPEIEIHIKPEYKPSDILEKLQPLIREAGYTEKQVSLEPYDDGARGYNELVLLFDFRSFSKKRIKRIIQLVKDVVKPYASLTDVKAC